jgi:hypothetical protein
MYLAVFVVYSALVSGLRKVVKEDAQLVFAASAVQMG